MASRREVVVATENYLRSKGYNNSTGKYDRVIMGVKSLLGETLLTYGSPEFERAIQQETERMLKKYVKDEAMEYDPIMCMMVPKKAEDAKTKVWVVTYEGMLDNYERTFTDKAEVEKFIRKGTNIGRPYNVKVNGKPVERMSTWTADEMPANMVADQRTVDANTIIESAKAYVKDAERLYNVAKRAKEDFFSTRDEYANRIRTYWVRNKQNMSSEEEEACKSAISKLNGMSYF